MSPESKALAVWPSTEELATLVRAAHGSEDPRSLDRLLTRVRPALVRFFERELPHDAAEDAAQVALMRLARSVARIKPEGARRYLLTLARNERLSARRRLGRERQRWVSCEVVEPIPAARTADERAECRDLVRAVRETGAILPPELRAVVSGILRGLEPAEIAAEEGMNATTVRTRLLRARTRLRNELRHYLPSGQTTPRERST